MTKKEFKERCSVHEYGKGQKKRTAIYFDWSEGYKYMVKATVEDVKRPELFNILYDWVFNEIQPRWYVEYKYAFTDAERFKVSIMG